MLSKSPYCRPTSSQLLNSKYVKRKLSELSVYDESTVFDDTQDSLTFLIEKMSYVNIERSIEFSRLSRSSMKTNGNIILVSNKRNLLSPGFENSLGLKMSLSESHYANSLSDSAEEIYGSKEIPKKELGHTDSYFLK